jgi:hypothetical protein
MVVVPAVLEQLVLVHLKLRPVADGFAVLEAIGALCVLLFVGRRGAGVLY